MWVKLSVISKHYTHVKYYYILHYIIHTIYVYRYLLEVEGWVSTVNRTSTNSKEAESPLLGYSSPKASFTFPKAKGTAMVTVLDTKSSRMAPISLTFSGLARSNNRLHTHTQTFLPLVARFLHLKKSHDTLQLFLPSWFPPEGCSDVINATVKSYLKQGRW